ISKESFFTILMILGIVSGLAMFAFSKPLRKIMESSEDDSSNDPESSGEVPPVTDPVT
ncbi:MAG: hypothetical protein HQK54_18220, partial [Oligoflexales bacterium]|nr:hypothetical protein [Oligoflexales bacterium]